MRAYERFLRYVKIHTTSDPDSESCPSTQCQFDLAKILVEEMKEIGLAPPPSKDIMRAMESWEKQHG